MHGPIVVKKQSVSLQVPLLEMLKHVRGDAAALSGDVDYLGDLFEGISPVERREGRVRERKGVGRAGIGVFRMG